MNYLIKIYCLLSLLFLTNCNDTNKIDAAILSKDAVTFHRVCNYECEKFRDSSNLTIVRKKIFQMALLIDTVVQEIINESGGITPQWSMARPNATIDAEQIFKNHHFFNMIRDNMNSINEYNQIIKNKGIIYLNNDVYDVLFDEKSLFNKRQSNKILASQLIINLSALEHHMLSVMNSNVVRRIKGLSKSY